MNLHPEALPREGYGIGNDSAMGEGLIELEVIGMSGECILTLNVADSVLGRDLWKMILGKVPSKPGLQLVVSHTSRLVLHESLQQQGLRGQRAQVSVTYMPVNLHAAWRFAQGYSVEDAEFSLTGIAEVTGVDDETPALLSLLHNLPQSLRILTFGGTFNQSLDNVTWPAGLQSLTFDRDFNQSLDNVMWPAGLQSLTFGYKIKSLHDLGVLPGTLVHLEIDMLSLKR